MLKGTPGLCTLLLEIKIEECSGWHRTRLASELWGLAHGEVNGHAPWPHVTLYTGCRYVRPCCVHDCFSLCAGPAAKPKQEEPSHVEKEETPVQKAKSEPVTSLSRPAIFPSPRSPTSLCFHTFQDVPNIFSFSWRFLTAWLQMISSVSLASLPGLICHCLQSHHLQAEQAIRDSSTCGHLV